MSIKHWLASERPREKLLSLGAESLSNAELLAIFLRHGSRGSSAVELARTTLEHFGELSALLNANYSQFKRIKGFGKVKYIELQAILELNRRYLYENLSKQTIQRSEQAYDYLLAKLSQRKREIFACLLLDNQNRLIHYQELFQGSLRQADIYPREIVKVALEHNAAAIILAHNHPSGHATPSDMDICVTAQIRQALKLVDIHLLDHIVIGHGETSSIMQIQERTLSLD